MAIVINGDNRGIITEGDLTINTLNFQLGQGVKSASGIHYENAETVEAEELPGVEVKNNNYPPITETQKNFFEKQWRITGILGGKTEAVDIPLEFIMHTIYDMTKEWDPSTNTSVRKWRIMYELLRRKNLFRILEKQKYAGFVKAVVKYCFPCVQETYNNNISKIVLDNSYSEWEFNDQALFTELKKTLFPDT